MNDVAVRMSDAEKLIEARKFSPEIAAWIDRMVLQGHKPAAIVRTLKASVELARAASDMPGLI